MVLNKNEAELERLMREGQAAAKRGDKAMARVLLTQLLEVQPDNEQAWMWLSGVVSDPNEQTTCLENVLILNPENPQARKGLEFIRTKSIGTKDLSVATANEPAGRSLDTDTLVPFDHTATEAHFQPPPVTAEPAPTVLEPQAPAPPPPPAPTVQPGPATFAPFGAGVNDLPDFLQTMPGTSSATSAVADNHAPQPPAPTFAPPEPPAAFAPPQLPAAEPFVPVDGVAPFQVPDESDMHTYKGGPPTPGLPPDMGAAIPEWVRGAEASLPQPAQPPTGHPDDASRHDLTGTETAGFAAGAMAASSAAPTSSVPSTGPSPETDFNAWLEDIASSASSKFNFEEQAEQEAAASNPEVPATGSGPLHTTGPFGPTGSFPTDPFANPGPLDFAPVGPYASTPLPSPDDLPSDRGADGQPWYLQSTHQSGYINSPSDMADDTAHYAQGSGGHAAATASATVATIECPYCYHHVPETSLACPECRYTFFVHCPHCHELVDTSLAREGVIEPCPYCGVELNKWDLGLNSSRGLIMPHAVAKESDQSWLGEGIKGPRQRRVLNFGWLVDLMWLIIVVLMVWALTQLPAWLHLTGLYN